MACALIGATTGRPTVAGDENKTEYHVVCVMISTEAEHSLQSEQFCPILTLLSPLMKKNESDMSARSNVL